MEHNTEEKIIEKFVKDASSVRLSYGEKSALKSKIFAEVGIVPRRTVVSIFQNMYVSAALSASLFVIVLGVPVVFASENSLPGDPLYGFKTRVNEPFVNLFVAPADKAAYHLSLAERRVEELTQLAEQKNLNPVKAKIIEKNLLVHSADVLKDVSASESSVSTDVLFSHEEDLLSVLATYGDVVQSLKEDDENGKSQGEEALAAAIEDIQEYVEQKVEAFTQDASNEELEELQESLEEQVTTLLAEDTTEAPSVHAKQTATMSLSATMTADVDPVALDFQALSDVMNDEAEESIEEKEAILKTLIKQKSDIRSARRTRMIQERIQRYEDEKETEVRVDTGSEEDEKESDTSEDQGFFKIGNFEL